MNMSMILSWGKHVSSSDEILQNEKGKQWTRWKDPGNKEKPGCSLTKGELTEAGEFANFLVFLSYFLSFLLVFILKIPKGDLRAIWKHVQ